MSGKTGEDGGRVSSPEKMEANRKKIKAENPPTQATDEKCRTSQQSLDRLWGWQKRSESFLTKSYTFILLSNTNYCGDLTPSAILTGPSTSWQNCSSFDAITRWSLLNREIMWYSEYAIDLLLSKCWRLPTLWGQVGVGKADREIWVKLGRPGAISFIPTQEDSICQFQPSPKIVFHIECSAFLKTWFAFADRKHQNVELWMIMFFYKKAWY